MGMGGLLHALATLTPGKRSATHCVGGWLSPRAGLGDCGKSHPYRDSIPGPSSLYRVAVPTELFQPTFVN